MKLSPYRFIMTLINVWNLESTFLKSSFMNIFIKNMRLLESTRNKYSKECKNIDVSLFSKLLKKFNSIPVKIAWSYHVTLFREYHLSRPDLSMKILQTEDTSASIIWDAQFVATLTFSLQLTSGTIQIYLFIYLDHHRRERSNKNAATLSSTIQN